MFCPLSYASQLGPTCSPENTGIDGTVCVVVQQKRQSSAVLARTVSAFYTFGSSKQVYGNRDCVMPAFLAGIMVEGLFTYKSIT